jgi:hypothetical protein
MRSRSPGTRKGGRLQRQRSRAHVDEHLSSPARIRDGVHQFDSKAAFHGVKGWAWGRISATQLQDDMNNAYFDQVALLRRLNMSSGHASKSLRVFAGLGSSGRYTGNIKRDLVAALGDPQVPLPHFEEVHMLASKGAADDTPQAVDFPILLPHEFFAHMYKTHPKRFASLFLDSAEGHNKALPAFWSEAARRKDPRLQYHPMCREPSWMERAVPYSLHGDAVPCLNIGKPGTRSFDTYSWQGILSRGTTKEVKLYIFGLFEHVKTDHTMSQIWTVVMWSLSWMLKGLWPDRDHMGNRYPKGSDYEKNFAGTPLAGGLFGVLWSVKSDLEHLNKAYGLRRFNSENPCEFCPACRNGDASMWYNNFRTDAAWKTMLYTRSEWRSLREHQHPLFAADYMGCHNIEVDELHVMHLGTSQYMLGSILWLLCYEILPGRPEENMCTVWAAVCESYKDLKTDCQFTSLALSSFCDPKKPSDSYPKLKGKGAEVKCMVEPLLQVYAKYQRGTQVDALVISMLKHQVELQSTLSDHADLPFLPLGEARLVMKAVCSILKDYTMLANIADERSLLLFNIAPKFHWLYHFGQKAIFLNPRKGNCSLDEDFVGVCKEIVQSCAHATAAHKLPASFADKYRWGQHFLCVYGDQYDQ